MNQLSNRTAYYYGFTTLREMLDEGCRIFVQPTERITYDLSDDDSSARYVEPTQRGEIVEVHILRPRERETGDCMCDLDIIPHEDNHVLVVWYNGDPSEGNENFYASDPRLDTLMIYDITPSKREQALDRHQLLLFESPSAA